jgi:hypothetical protein
MKKIEIFRLKADAEDTVKKVEELSHPSSMFLPTSKLANFQSWEKSLPRTAAASNTSRGPKLCIERIPHSMLYRGAE